MQNCTLHAPDPPTAETVESDLLDTVVNETIKVKNDYPIHPAAHIFPAMTAEEFGGLKADIAEHGQRDPATIWNGQLIDGRNRLKACNELGIELDCQELDPDLTPDPVAWIVSYNLHRRHLTASQRALIAADLLPTYHAMAKERQKASGGNHKEKSVVENLPQPGKARDQVAAIVGVSGRMVSDAAKVQAKAAPEVVQAVRAGEITVNAAIKTIEPAAKKTEHKTADAARCDKSPDGKHAWDTDRDGTKFCTECKEDYDAVFHGAVEAVEVDLDSINATLTADQGDLPHVKVLELATVLIDGTKDANFGSRKKADLKLVGINSNGRESIGFIFDRLVEFAFPRPAANDAVTTKARSVLASLAASVDELIAMEAGN